MIGILAQQGTGKPESSAVISLPIQTIVSMSFLATASLLCIIVALALSTPHANAGEWIVETHSLTVRAPATIAGIEDAAIADVRLLC